MEVNDKITIRLELHDQELPVTIPREGEELTRRAARLINETLNPYFETYAGQRKDTEILYMAMLNIALQLEKERRRNDSQPFVDTLSKITSEIEDVLQADDSRQQK